MGIFHNAFFSYNFGISLSVKYKKTQAITINIILFRKNGHSIEHQLP